VESKFLFTGNVKLDGNSTKVKPEISLFLRGGVSLCYFGPSEAIFEVKFPAKGIFSKF
jgi:hypothetical protein